MHDDNKDKKDLYIPMTVKLHTASFGDGEWDHARSWPAANDSLAFQ